MCIFAGCDFLKALPGIGMKKAHQHVKRLKSHRKVLPLQAPPSQSHAAMAAMAARPLQHREDFQCSYDLTRAYPQACLRARQGLELRTSNVPCDTDSLLSALQITCLGSSYDQHGPCAEMTRIKEKTNWPLVSQVCKSLRFSGVSVPRDYEPAFQRALWTFQHQRVWCPQHKQLVHVRPLPTGGLASGEQQPGPVCL